MLHVPEGDVSSAILDRPLDNDVMRIFWDLPKKPHPTLSKMLEALCGVDSGSFTSPKDDVPFAYQWVEKLTSKVSSG